MSEQKKWYYIQSIYRDGEDGEICWDVFSPDDVFSMEVYVEKDAKRACDLFNAMQGIKDPGDFMECLKSFLYLTANKESGPATMALQKLYSFFPTQEASNDEQ